MQAPTSPVRENISLLREQRKSPVRVTSKTGKKRQGESNNSEKKIRPSEGFFDQYASQTDSYDSEFEWESQSVQSLNFDKDQKIDNQCEMGPPLHEKMTDIICSNSASLISQTTSKEIQKKFLLPRNCPLWIPLVNTELLRIMSSNQRKDLRKICHTTKVIN